MKALKEMRVLGYPWHTAHQYELAKLFGQYDMLMNYYRTWGYVSRPMPQNMREVVAFDPKDYDLAILHIDQQCIDPRIGKGLLTKNMIKMTEGMPRVLINHMTPFHDQYENDEVIEKMREIVGDIPMIVNSKTAAAQWGWGTPIIHGLEIDEYEDLPKEPRVVASVSTGGMNKAYFRELLHATMDILEERGIQLIWIPGNHKCKNWEEYKEYIARSLVFVNLVKESPMPRARTEAMLSGCCIVSTRHQDWESYIEEGVDGFIVKDNPKAAAKLIEELVTVRVKEAREIGRRGRIKAQKLFNHDRWAKDWEEFLKGVIK